METISFGDLEVGRVVEWRGSLRTVSEILPDAPAEVWDANRSWLSPDFWNPVTGAYQIFVQTWVIRGPGRTVLVDTGIGDDRDRPQVPQFAHLRTGFLDRLSAAGVRPEQVDIVINTHLHHDHVGWNTRLDAGGWVPAFPNATYLVPRADYDHYRPGGTARMLPAHTDDERRRLDNLRLVFADSIEPIESAGQLVLWEGEHRIDDTLRLESAPGHTPGSSVVWLESRDARAVFVGDLMHSPVQILHPGYKSCFDLDAETARASRRRVLAAAARTGATVFPAHFGGHGAVTVQPGPGPDAFAVSWANLAPEAGDLG
ncbi:MBL fold metallo-hydrolase [Streptosporangium lutulentum]|uniref:Glyoxylase-like metal-dependent hydrolase (Beta-lactamase superfamily II) n=1 Tax=Streptosporangium lutulentum TaxID=1461250 RepID=A0ABT9QNI1_9ACTN|nr:MBL fold metallo-hydrolase [Streptosporangium lutulentum]MDP9848296.1 glyoxylase-like metal-dependent hydrolase (beta-lactamase superfamily II) [Streptosporangium lutulentum]